METYRLIASVAALVSESLLVDMHKPAMPGEKHAGEVYERRLLDMGHDKIVELKTQEYMGTESVSEEHQDYMVTG